MKDWKAALAGGVGGTAILILILLTSDAVTGTEIRPFELLAGYVGFPQQFMGFVLFVIVGVIAWPLVFLSFEPFLPGEADTTRSVVFSVILWIGFLGSFGTTYEGSIIVFSLVTLIAHLAYGVVLGATYDRFADHNVGGV